jgi:hypothetical protein
VRSALAAHAAVDVSGVSAVLEVVAAGCRQSSLQPLGPFRVGLGQSPHLVGSQAKVTQHSAERPPAVDGVEQLLPYLPWYRFCALARPNALCVVPASTSLRMRSSVGCLVGCLCFVVIPTPPELCRFVDIALGGLVMVGARWVVCLGVGVRMSRMRRHRKRTQVT